MKQPVIMVCVTGQLTCENLIYGAVEIAKELGGARIKIIHVALKNRKLLGCKDDGEALEFLFQLSKDFGADMTVVRADNVTAALAKYARKISAEVILIGTKNADVPNALGIQLQNILPDCEVRMLDTDRNLRLEKIGIAGIAQFDF